MLGRNVNNDRFNINADDINNNGRALEWPLPLQVFSMKTYRDLWEGLISWNNLALAYEQAKKHKSLNPKVMEFSKNWRLNLCILFRELRTKRYRPQPLKTFVLRDPKTRVICVSDFRDRVVHHALINILQPIFEPRFIHDSYASRRGKGVLSAIERFDQFKRSVSQNGRVWGGGQTQAKSMVLSSRQISRSTFRVLTMGS
ncbi:MAG TPA: hypothetical protein VJH22_07195 [Candidatus Nanoarchaeia archaeon]|nr:hypothetical protein [Candidatus Nanoarchaeia archaeon]